jgi:hypothetical protein
VKTTVLALLFVMSLATFAQQPQMGKSASEREFEKRERQITARTNLPVPVQRPKLDLRKIKREADELARLAQAVPPKIDQAGHGALPKDLGENLKKIQNLSKQLRRDLSL